ncbi:LytR/AlgR family response regulator transcription factor [Croceibacter atlanticus]|mgnify:CR=1 FL=1|jgi:DNA-binding LytR/AlgR family response regulator|uniref:LytR/AlgR family response regulator transcription factor n=1 Tax=Croceibacter atlanticus TaxID=313588 RepID=UPI0024B8FFF5|nr:LytTR family DNA-binding domain-containing protein [Croceibacter atlanticus]|tara:strand:- start:728 stop:1402 length:675 start_codon:yes stop_codon:yes gene_type:complete
MSSISCIIIDDEELARTLLETYVTKVDFLEYKGQFENPLEALSYLKNNSVDLIFLDIQMPELKGTEFAQLISKSDARVIFTTAYSEYALEGFELSALDYLLKPITFKRFLSAVEKFPKSDNASDNHLVIKSGYDLHKVLLDDILYIKSDSEYVNYHLSNGRKILTNQSLKNLESKLPDSFLRVHRSYIINKGKVTGLKSRELLLLNIKIPVSDSYYEIVRKKIF